MLDKEKSSLPSCVDYSTFFFFLWLIGFIVSILFLIVGNL